MSLDILSKDILLKADDYKKEINKKFQEKTTSIEKESNKYILNSKNNLKSKFDEELKLNKDKILGIAKRDSKKLILETKSDLIKESFEISYKKLLEIDNNIRENLLSKLIKKAKKIIDYNLIECSKKDFKFIKSKVDKNSKIKVKINENLSGLLFYSNDKKEKLDLSFKTILNDIFEKNENKIQKILFNK